MQSLSASIPFACMASDCIDKIIIKRDLLEIYIKMTSSKNLVSDILRRALPAEQSDKIKIFQVPYNTVRQKAGAIVIQTENLEKDAFDLPPAKLQKFI